MRFRMGAVVAAAMVALGGGPAASPAQAVQPRPTVAADNSAAAKAEWKRLWGPAKISAHYLNTHGKRWVSRTFDPNSSRTLGAFRCWNSNDGGQARLRIYNVETRRYIASSGWQPCDWTWSYVQTSRYRNGHGLRFVLEAKGKAHTTYVSAYARR